eukprot:m.117528 g.117528  ORF g.117528 m.117528 type:complete len:54 (+) comp13199_c0_seq1:372-533(+)
MAVQDDDREPDLTSQSHRAVSETLKAVSATGTTATRSRGVKFSRPRSESTEAC